MASYKLVIKKSVAKDLRPIPNKDVARILQRIEELRENPRPAACEKLSGQERYRIRQGVYRIIYEVADEMLVVTVVKVGHRKQVYGPG
jgi:mRNA interferase RelE/StbE